MPDAVFPFPGGKSRLASWILEYVPEHTCFVEVFGGAAGVLVNKDPDRSTVEVYNDRDGDLVQFFEVLCDREEELVEWLETVPYSREVHSEWADAFYNGYRPSDAVERAGQFFYLQYSQWGSGYATINGFGTSKVTNEAQSYANKIDRLGEFAERFDDVVLENLDWSEVFEKYDGEETVFYCDPPYVGKKGYYPVSDIEHSEFVSALVEEGDWLVSDAELPGGLDDYPGVGRGEKKRHGQRKVREREEDALDRGGAVAHSTADLLPLQRLARYDDEMLASVTNRKPDELTAKAWRERDDPGRYQLWTSGSSGWLVYLKSSDLADWIRANEEGVSKSYAQELAQRTLDAMQELSKHRLITTQKKRTADGLTYKENVVVLTEEADLPGERSLGESDGPATDEVAG
ncbi:DNA adenine methylase [Halorussus salinus]|uniref:DNA adenine methylase n=1 Tax=Halorussus salinus TaxID=1364935 RepID=UPI0010928D90|nr:DNA adenine methylase [Halorussus salinus]